MSKWTKNQIVQVATLYYKKDISQKDISEMMGLSKMAISRMLQKAKELNIINIDIVPPFKLNKNLGLRIEEKYQIDQAIVVKIEDDKQKVSSVLGKVWAFYMGISDLKNKIIGVGVGNTIGSMVNHLSPIRSKNTHIIQLMGGLIDVLDSNPFTIVQNMCKKLEAKGAFLTSFATVDNKKIRDRIITSSYERNSKLGNYDMAIFGIGAIEKGTLLSPDLIKPEEFKELKEKKAVGDILGHCFDEKGNFISSNLENRLVSVPINRLKKFKKRIALVGGDYKRIAVNGALLSGVINILVINEKLAKKII